MEKYSLQLYKSSSGRQVIEEFIYAQDPKTRLRIRNGINLLKRYGLSLLQTKWVRKIYNDPGLFELRIKSDKEIRLIFVSYERSFIILHIFIKKKQKLPREELKVALTRIKEFIF